jgi:hypothetical protein
MTAPNLDQVETNDPTFETPSDPIDSSSEQSTVQEVPAAPVAPAIDWTAMYRESLAERRRMEQELEELRQQRNAPTSTPEEDITDDYFEKHGTAKGVHAVVKKTVAELLRESLGEVGEISQDYKRNKQLSTAEEKFYQSYPQLAGYREQLSPNVRQLLSNAPSIDPATYERTTLAAIGYLTINNLAAQNNTPQTPTSNAPSVPSAPTPRSAGTPVRTPTRRLTELERSAMKRAGFDPNDGKSIQEFFAIVENDEGVTV